MHGESGRRERVRGDVKASVNSERGRRPFLFQVNEREERPMRKAGRIALYEGLGEGLES